MKKKFKPNSNNKALVKEAQEEFHFLTFEEKDIVSGTHSICIRALIKIEPYTLNFPSCSKFTTTVNFYSGMYTLGDLESFIVEQYRLPFGTRAISKPTKRKGALETFWEKGAQKLVVMNVLLARFKVRYKSTIRTAVFPFHFVTLSLVLKELFDPEELNNLIDVYVFGSICVDHDELLHLFLERLFHKPLTSSNAQLEQTIFIIISTDADNPLDLDMEWQTEIGFRVGL